MLWLDCKQNQANDDHPVCNLCEEKVRVGIYFQSDFGLSILSWIFSIFFSLRGEEKKQSVHYRGIFRKLLYT